MTTSSRRRCRCSGCGGRWLGGSGWRGHGAVCSRRCRRRGRRGNGLAKWGRLHHQRRGSVWPGGTDPRADDDTECQHRHHRDGGGPRRRHLEVVPRGGIGRILGCCLVAEPRMLQGRDQLGNAGCQPTVPRAALQAIALIVRERRGALRAAQNASRVEALVGGGVGQRVGSLAPRDPVDVKIRGRSGSLKVGDSACRNPDWATDCSQACIAART